MIRMTKKFKSIGRGYSLRKNEPLTNDEMYRVAPSIFTPEAAHDRSERYTHIPTNRVIDNLRSEGFEPFMVAQTRCRTEENAPFARHMIRLRHHTCIEEEIANEIILTNSHNGTGGFALLSGFFREVCANGCIAGDELATIKVQHRGNIIDAVIEGVYSVLDNLEKIDESRDAMKSLILAPPQQLDFALKARDIKWPNRETINPGDIIIPHRTADTEPSLWNLFNRAQENLIKGGIKVSKTENTRKYTTRRIRAIDENIRVNQALWNLAHNTLRESA